MVTQSVLTRSKNIIRATQWCVDTEWIVSRSQRQYLHQDQFPNSDVRISNREEPARQQSCTETGMSSTDSGGFGHPTYNCSRQQWCAGADRDRVAVVHRCGGKRRTHTTQTYKQINTCTQRQFTDSTIN